MQAAHAHCAALVRAADRDRYLASLFLPSEIRPHVLALYAFNVEIASVRERVAEPLVGEIRLQWWRDAIAGRAPDGVYGNPVAAALLDAVERRNIPRGALDELIDARRFDVGNEMMPTQGALDIYLRATASSLFRLAARMLTDGKSIDTAAEEAGLGYGLTGLLRAFPMHAARGQVFLPADLLDAAGVTHADIERGRSSPGLRSLLAQMRSRARQHLTAARTLIMQSPDAAKPAFLPLALADGYLACMDRSDYDPFSSRIEVPQWRRQWVLWRAARR